MSDLNNCTVVGRLTKDAEMKQVGAKGTTLVTFTIANNTGFGQYAKTNYFNVNAWGTQAANILSYLVRGKQVGVSGQMENNRWQDNQGVWHDSWTLKAQGEICLMADGKQSTSTFTQPEQEPDPVF